MREPISCETDFFEEENIEDIEISFKWYEVRTRLFETEQEKREKREAIRHQQLLGVIQPNGLPAGVTYEQLGMTPPPRRQLPRQIRRPVNNLGNQPLKTDPRLLQKFGLRR